MRVAVIAAEAVPYSKTGGLGDVAGALPKALKNVGVDAALITPHYRQTDSKHLGSRAMDDLSVPWRGGVIHAGAFYSEANGSPTFLIDAPAFFHRDSIYGFSDDHERFAFFNSAALALLRRIGEAPDIVHLNDWHCGFGAVAIRESRRRDPFWQKTRTVFSIHNMAYQGGFGLDELSGLGFTSPAARDSFALDGHASAMKAGLEASDMLSTVSRSYAKEIQTSEYGYGLEWLTRRRSNELVGITNGVDYEVWNPATDHELFANFDIDDLAGKAECKRALLSEFGLPVDIERPIFASITRLTLQKGVDLMMRAAPDILDAGAYIISLGSGERRYEEFWQRLRDHAPRQVGIYTGYSESLAHRIEAGADIFMMPSKFEPCGLNQMYSLRYGTVPVVRAVGGLDDTVLDYDASSGRGNGFKFRKYSGDRFVEKLYEALYAFSDKESWRGIQRNGMLVDNSWENAASRYVELYRAVCRID